MTSASAQLQAKTNLEDVSPILALVVESLVEHFHYFYKVVSGVSKLVGDAAVDSSVRTDCK